MKPEVKQFIESLQPEFEYVHIETNAHGSEGIGTYVTLPYLGRILIKDTTTNFDLVRLFNNDGIDRGVISGKQELANDLKKLLQIPNDYD